MNELKDTLEIWERPCQIESCVWRMWQCESIQMSDEADEDESLEADAILSRRRGQGSTRRLAPDDVDAAAALVSIVVARLGSQESGGPDE